MFGLLLVALAICLAHHVFLSYLDGRSVDDFAISQSWIRDIGNALADTVQFLLKVSVGITLAQSVRIPGLRYVYKQG